MVVAARGSSDNAARYAQYLFGVGLHLPVALAAPSVATLYDAPIVPSGAPALVIGISQSGRSPDIVATLASAAKAGACTVAITNAPDSPLSSAVEHVLDLRVGEERSVASTKTYTASLLALARLAIGLQLQPRPAASIVGHTSQALDSLAKVPLLVQETISRAFDEVSRLDPYARARHLVVLGRGFNYSTALETALKVRELTSAIAEGYSPADLMHGPIAAIAPGTPALLLAIEGRALRSVLGAAPLLDKLGARTILIGSHADASLTLPRDIPEWLTPIVAAIPGQVLALRLASLSDRPIDSPPALQKITETY